eukprot:13811-Rhodomonas_salina.1
METLIWKDWDTDSATRLRTVLCECNTLAGLDLSLKPIDGEGAGKLAVRVLCECDVLAHLVLSFNQFGIEGGGILAVGLRDCKALAHLYLSYTGIGAEGPGKLVGVL